MPPKSNAVSLHSNEQASKTRPFVVLGQFDRKNVRDYE